MHLQTGRLIHVCAAKEFSLYKDQSRVMGTEGNRGEGDGESDKKKEEQDLKEEKKARSRIRLAPRGTADGSRELALQPDDGWVS